ncbi:MAG TPA: heme o synthase, partial [Acidimicrobiales bacterium]|nr:heme o synthase [Acidimicrobiales bacterium]
TFSIAGQPLTSSTVLPNASVFPAAPRASSARPALGLVGRLGAFVALTKPRIIELLLITTVPTMVVAAGGWPSLRLVAATLVGGTMSAGGANAANMYLDRDIDAVMRRTAHRPLVTGAVSASSALLFAVALEVGAFFILWAFDNLLSAVLALSAALFYVFVYTAVLKRLSPQNIVIGGAAGAVPVLVGWAAVRGSLTWAPMALFALVFLWTPPHFWALAIRYRDDYARARVPMMPVVRSVARTSGEVLAYAVATLVASTAFGLLAHMRWLYWLVALLGGATFVAMCARLLASVATTSVATTSTSAATTSTSTTTASAAMRVFHWSITYLSLLFVAMALDVVVR